MKNIKANIDHYMERKGIRFYSDLLIDIAHQLGIMGKDAYDFAEREKANFSKMLRGDRPLKYEFIIPLEKIFGVSLARILDEDAYKLPVDKENVPIVKGYRYYAYMDDTALYEKELDMFLTKEGESSLTCTDEFGKTFVDYVVEYNSKNAVRFLREKYHIKMRFWNNQFTSSLNNSFSMFTHSGVEFARLVASMNDPELFNDIYDSYYILATGGNFLANSLWMKDDFAEIILDNEQLFKSMFVRKTYVHQYSPMGKRKTGKESTTISAINPLINICLYYALKHLPKYKKQAIEIISYGIQHNKRVRDGLTDESSLMVDESGILFDYLNKEFVDVVIENTYKDYKDEEIKSLISKMPTFYRPYHRRND